MELVDVVDSKSTASDGVPVRVRPPAPKFAPIRVDGGEFFVTVGLEQGGGPASMHASYHSPRRRRQVSFIARHLLSPRKPCFRGGPDKVADSMSGHRHHVVADFVSFAAAFLYETPSLIHFVAPPFQIKPAALGFDLVRRRPCGWGRILVHQTNIIRTRSSLSEMGSDYLFISRNLRTPTSETASSDARSPNHGARGSRTGSSLSEMGSDSAAITLLFRQYRPNFFLFCKKHIDFIG